MTVLVRSSVIGVVSVCFVFCGAALLHRAGVTWVVRSFG